MPDIVFTCTCKTAFQRWKRDDEAWVHVCPRCQATVTDALGPLGVKWAVDPLRLPGDQYDYISPQDGTHITSKRAHRDHLKRHGMIELGNEKPELGKFNASIPRDQIRAELRDNLERMKSHGTWREV